MIFDILVEAHTCICSDASYSLIYSTFLSCPCAERPTMKRTRLSRVRPFEHLSDDLVQYILGFVMMDGSEINRASLRDYRSLSLVSKTFSRVSNIPWPEVFRRRDWGGQQWVASPPLPDVFFVLMSGASRSPVEGVPRSTAIECMVPRTSFRSMHYRLYRVDGCTVKVYALDDVFGELCSIYPTIEDWGRDFQHKQRERTRKKALREEMTQKRRGRDREISDMLDSKGLTKLTIQSFRYTHRDVIQRYIQYGKAHLLLLLQVASEESRQIQQGQECARNERIERERLLVSRFPRLSSPGLEDWRRNSALAMFVSQGSGTDEEILRAVVEWEGRNSRRVRLVRELGRYGIGLREDSRFCRRYIEGAPNLCLQEAVATIRVHHYLMRTGWSENRRRIFEAKMKWLMCEGGYTDWQSAYEKTIASTTLRRLQRRCDQDQDSNNDE